MYYNSKDHIDLLSHLKIIMNKKITISHSYICILLHIKKDICYLIAQPINGFKVELKY